MVNFAVTCLILLSLPYLLGRIHARICTNLNSTIIYYRYFVIFNMILSGIFVIGRIFINSQIDMALYLYIIAVLSMLVMAILTVFLRKSIMLAPAICWSIFLILSTILHVYQVQHHDIAEVNIIYVHIIYNLIVSCILILYIFKINYLTETYAPAEIN